MLTSHTKWALRVHSWTLFTVNKAPIMEVKDMSKTKSITDLIMELQQENESLKGLAKIANQYCKMEFGYNVKELHELIAKQRLYEQKKQERQANQQGQHISLSRSE